MDHLGSKVQISSLLVLISLISPNGGQIQCPANLLTYFPNNSSVIFNPLPAGAENTMPEYDPGPIGGWYNLAGRFVDAVRPGSLPYDQIRETLTTAGVPCSLFPEQSGCDEPPTGGGFNVQSTIQSFATWWVGLLIVTIIGGLLAIGFCIGGMCFCCCRCCGNCGGKKTQQISDNMDCKAFTFTIILLLCLAVLFAGVVLAFFSNQQTFESVGNANTAINNVVTDAVTYINDTIDELEQVLCQLAADDGGVAGLVIDEARGFNGTLQDFVTDLERDVESIGQTITTNSPGFNMTVDVLTSINSTSAQLRQSGQTLNDTLQNISTAVSDIQMQCASQPSAVQTQCNAVSNNFETGANFDELPDVGGQLNEAKNAIEDINFDQLVQEGRQTFDGIRQSIDEGVSSNVDTTLNEVESYNSSFFGFVDNITTTVQEYIEDSFNRDACPSILDVFNNPQLNVGYFRECIINNAFNEIERYDVYRYAFGVVICSLALITIVLALLGILMGMCGFRKNRDPDQRTTLSHCGGVFLILGVIVTFVFGFVLLILCCVFFFFGSNVQKLCQSVAGPDYPLFEELVDNRTFWGGSLLGQYLPASNGVPPELYISEVLRNCERDTALFSAANLSFLLPSGQSVSQEISSRINLNEVRTTIDDALQNATNDFNFNSTSFLPNDVQDSLAEFRNSSVDQINITAFREQINAPLVTFDINEEVRRLMDLSTTLTTAGAVSIAAQVDLVVADLESINNTQIPAIQAQVLQLELQVNNLTGLIDTVVIETAAVVDMINEIIANITGQTLPTFLNANVRVAVDQVFGLLDQSIQHVDEDLSQNVARCYPLWSVYTQMHSTVCQDFIEGLNGFWWSLGFCAVMFIPVIIFSVLASNYFLKKKNELEAGMDGGYSGYDDYPMKGM